MGYQGRCLDSDGVLLDLDNKTSVKKVGDGDINTPEAEKECLNLCKLVEGAVGCVGIWGKDTRGCYASMKGVEKGNGEENHSCWIFPKTGKFVLHQTSIS